MTEIKAGDWFLHDDGMIAKCEKVQKTQHSEEDEIHTEAFWTARTCCTKITDPDEINILERIIERNQP